jgi:hypothetical protein
MDGMVGFNRHLDAETFQSYIPQRERIFAELYEVEIFDGPISAIKHVNEKRKVKIDADCLVGVD